MSFKHYILKIRRCILKNKSCISLIFICFFNLVSSFKIYFSWGLIQVFHASWRLRPLQPPEISLTPKLNIFTACTTHLIMRFCLLIIFIIIYIIIFIIILAVLFYFAHLINDSVFLWQHCGFMILLICSTFQR